MSLPTLSGYVHTGREEGMSVAPSPADLPPHYRPQRHGGTSALPCWSLDLDLLPSKIEHVTTSPTHGCLRVTEAMLLSAFQTILCATASSWEQLP